MRRPRAFFDAGGKITFFHQRNADVNNLHITPRSNESEQSQVVLWIQTASAQPIDANNLIRSKVLEC